EPAEQTGVGRSAPSHVGDESASVVHPRSQTSRGSGAIVVQANPPAAQRETARALQNIPAALPSAPPTAMRQLGAPDGVQQHDSLSSEVKALREISSLVDSEPTWALGLIA